MIALCGIVGLTVGQLVKSKHACGLRDPLPAKLSAEADLSVLYGFGSCGRWPWQWTCGLPMGSGCLSSHWYASAITIVGWVLYLGLHAQGAMDSCNKSET